MYRESHLRERHGFPRRGRLGYAGGTSLPTISASHQRRYPEQVLRDHV